MLVGPRQTLLNHSVMTLPAKLEVRPVLLISHPPFRYPHGNILVLTTHIVRKTFFEQCAIALHDSVCAWGMILGLNVPVGTEI
jgi:hypothetical protein